MADNVAITAGSGTTIAADDIGGVLHQRVKLSQGADGSATDVSSAAPLNVTLANTGANATAVKVDGSAVTQPVSGTVTITPSGTQTVSGTVAVSTINSVAPAFGTGVRGATVQRVTIATDDSVPVTIASVPSHAVTNAGTFVTQENGASLTSIQLLDDVVTAQATAIGTTKTSLVGVSTTTAAPTYTTGTINPLNSNTAGALRTDGSGVTQPVSGTVTANAGTGTMAVSIATAPVLVAGSAIIGKVGIDQTTPGTTNLVALAANQSVNVAQMNGVTTTMGNGVSGTGVQRVAIASDNTPFAVKTDQTTHGTTDLVAADITKVAGTAIVNGGVAGSQSVGGTVATNVAITANPLNLGAQAVSSENTAVTTARQVQLVADLVGKLIVLPYSNPENFVSGAITTAMTGTTSTSLIAAPAAGLRNYITQITVSNSHATVGTDVIIQDGNAGTTLYTIPAAAVYGGAVVTFPTPLRQPTTATAIYCANVTTGSSIKVSASGYKGA
jgi:hypothetical protein